MPVSNIRRIVSRLTVTAAALCIAALSAFPPVRANYFYWRSEARDWAPVTAMESRVFAGDLPPSAVYHLDVGADPWLLGQLTSDRVRMPGEYRADVARFSAVRWSLLGFQCGLVLVAAAGILWALRAMGQVSH